MAYNGRRGPNVSEYIANLNAIPSAQDLQSSENFNMEDELAMFTNTQFFDFDLGQDADLQPSFDGARGSQEIGSELKPLDFIPGESALSVMMVTAVIFTIIVILVFACGVCTLRRRPTSSSPACGVRTR
jgi:hypothetical protein